MDKVEYKRMGDYVCARRGSNVAIGKTKARALLRLEKMETHFDTLKSKANDLRIARLLEAGKNPDENDN